MKAKTALKKISLFEEIRNFIEEGKQQLSFVANATITYTYWRIGNRINQEILKNQRAAYGKKIVVSLSRQLTRQYGVSYEEKNLRRMMQFPLVYRNDKIVVSLSRQLSWSHIIALLPIKNEVQRDFYTQMAIVEGWSIKILRQKIDGLLFERTAISKKPDRLIKKELRAFSRSKQFTPDLVFKDPYFLDFTGLKDTYSEESLEDAILRELELFILELGAGFAFVARQKRMIIDGEDHHLDLLFFHRQLKRLVAIDLKLGKFKASYKGQMELYLRWLEKFEMNTDENPPIGLILCSEGNNEQIELLQLEKSGIKVARYFTELPDLNLIKKKLHQSILKNRKRFDFK